jgi:DeoR/GlpR family transcriptional regulator of sugar metabolism
VVTNSFPVAEELRKRPYVEVIFLGGSYNKESQTTVGDMVYHQLKDYYFDQCFLGAYGIDAVKGLTSPHPYEDETPVKKYIVENSKVVNIMGAFHKLDQVSNYVTCSIDQIDHIICEGSVTKEMNRKYQNKIC